MTGQAATGEVEIAEVVKNTCRCGATVKRPIPVDDPHGWARKLAAVCTTCDACIRADEEAEEARQAAVVRAQAETRCNLPGDLRGIDLAGLQVDGNLQALEAAKAWAAGHLAGLVLTGDVGVGKTTIAAAAVWARPRLAVWASVPVLVARAFGDDQAKQDATRVLTGRGPLVLDDIDKVKPGDWVASQLFAAIDSRITAGAPLLVTTNLTVGELANTIGGRFGDPIASRLAGYSEIHRVTGPDRRLAAPIHHLGRSAA